METRVTSPIEDKAVAPAEVSQEELDELRRTVAEQTQHLDALTSRLEFMSSREAEMRAMLIDAHEQLIDRDREIQRLSSQQQQWQAQIDELTSWAEGAVGDVVARDAVITDLQASLEEQTSWAQRAVAEVAARDALIADLRAELQRVQRMLPLRLSRAARKLARLVIRWREGRGR